MPNRANGHQSVRIRSGGTLTVTPHCQPHCETSVWAVSLPLPLSEITTSQHCQPYCHRSYLALARAHSGPQQGGSGAQKNKANISAKLKFLLSFFLSSNSELRLACHIKLVKSESQKERAFEGLDQLSTAPETDIVMARRGRRPTLCRVWLLATMTQVSLNRFQTTCSRKSDEGLAV